MDDESNKVGWKGITIIIVSALLADLISLIPFAGAVTVLIFWGGVTWYLHKKGHGWINGKRAITGVLTIAGEWIPAIQAFPVTTLGAIVLIFFIKVEEKTGISVTSIVKPGKAPLNRNGVRMPHKNIAPLNTDGIRSPRSPVRPLPTRES